MHSILLPLSSLILSFPEWKPHFSFLRDAAANELMMLRLLHFIFGIVWIGHEKTINFVLQFANSGAPQA